jgi:uncharacterized membrane protein YeaQ/YmgE (transglycosylase-associated protein family)
VDLKELLIVGVVAGLIIGLFPDRHEDGRFRNILVGTLGAILGTFLYEVAISKIVSFKLPKYNLPLDLNHIALALVGALILLFVMKLIGRRHS